MISTKVQAHRGASAYRPENTLEAFSLAIEQNADGVELDVHLSKDGHVVVAHDERLERVSNGTGFINNHTLAELKELNFNKLFPEQPICRIPTLGEVYELLGKTSLLVNIELKTTQLLYPELPQKLLELESTYGMSEQVMYSSFNHYSLIALHQIAPRVKTGLLYSIGIIDPWIYAKYANAYAIHPHYSAIAALPETVEKCHENGIKVNVWTVDDPKVITCMFKYGVDTVITNTPDIALEIRDSQQLSD